MAQTLDGNDLLVLGQEVVANGTVREEPKGGDGESDGDNTGDEEDDLIGHFSARVRAVLKSANLPGRCAARLSGFSRVRMRLGNRKC